MAKMSNTNGAMSQQVCRATTMLVQGWWERKIEQTSSCKVSNTFIINIYYQHFYHAVIYHPQMKYIHEVNAQVFIAAYFMTSNKWKQNIHL